MNVLARCVKLSGDPTPGVLLFRLNYWSRFASILRGGETWVVKYKSEWCEDTGLTPKQYALSLVKLQNLGLIVTEKHMWKGHSLTFLRLTETAKTAIEMDEHKSLEVLPGKSLEGSTHITKEIHQSDTFYEDITNPPTPQKELSGEKTDMKVEDILNGAIPKKNFKKKNLETMEMVWKHVHAEVYEGKFINLTQKQIGQLNKFKKTCPPGTAGVVLEKVIRDWAYFVGTVKAEAGLHTVPATPNVDFLLKHVQVAVNFTQTPAVDVGSQPKPKVQLIAKKPKPVNHQKASLDDLHDILLGDGKDDDGSD